MVEAGQPVHSGSVCFARTRRGSPSTLLNGLEEDEASGQVLIVWVSGWDGMMTVVVGMQGKR